MAITTLKRRAARWLCATSELAYRTSFNQRVPTSDDAGEVIPLTVLMFVGHAHVPQAVASLRSFVRYAGRPARVIAGSDGTLRDSDEEILSTVVARIEVARPRLDDVNAFPEIVDYARSQMMGRKLLFIVSASAQYQPPLLYFDSDVLFFPGARLLWPALSGLTRPAYMEEPNRASFDSRWDSGAQSVANAGFLYFPGPLNWKSVLESNAGLLEAPTFWTEQTLVNLALRDAGATPLDAREFVLDYHDARSPRDITTRGHVVARHYVAPIRWKFWIRVAGGWNRAIASALSKRWFGPA